MSSTPTTPEHYTRSGLTITRRSAKSGAKFTTRIRFKKEVHHVTLADTVEESFKAAVLARREIHAGRWAQFKEATALRSPEKFATLEEIRTAYHAFPGGDRGIKPDTKKRNLQALDRFLRTALAASKQSEDGPPAPHSVPLQRLTGKLVSEWKW